MAWIETRATQAGEVHRVVWRQNGAKEQQTFTERPAAEDFLAHVKASGDRWPRGWVKGKGWADEVGDQGAPTFRHYAEQTITARSKADARTKADYLAMLERHVYPLIGDKPVDRITRFDVSAVADKMTSEGKAPKTIANVHALLSSVLRDAVGDELVHRNPAVGALRVLPDVKTEDMVFLTPQEFALIAHNLPVGTERDLARLLFGTGLRWSEATALQRHDVDLLNRRVLHVRRAWKRRGGLFELGGPKTNRGRRTLTLSAELVDLLAGYMVGDPAGFVFTTVNGRPIRHSNYYNRVWLPAVAAAQEDGLESRPGLHALRHSHVGVLIDEKVTLPAIQRRLGHESIQTTIDRYGHLMPDHADEINAAVDRALTVR